MCIRDREIYRLKNLDMARMAMDEEDLKNFDKSTFIADTGASTHMVNSDDGMFDCKEICEPVMMCNGKKIIATKIGKARMTALQVDGTTTDVVLHGVKYVPGLNMNLFSVLRSIELGWNISNDKRHLKISRDKMTLRFDREHFTKNGKLVGINLVPRLRPSSGEVALSAEEEPKPTKSWNINRLHQVFNHGNEESLRKTAKAYNWKVTGKMDVCIECQESNIRQKAVAKMTETKSDKAGERIFIDTTSIKERTLGGSKFMIGIVDDYSSFAWGNMLKRKKDQVPTLMLSLIHI